MGYSSALPQWGQVSVCVRCSGRSSKKSRSSMRYHPSPRAKDIFPVGVIDGRKTHRASPYESPAEILRWSLRQEIVDAPHSRKYSILRRAGASWEGCMAKKNQAKFSATKAVKRNARERVGQPKPERVIASEPQQADR